MNDYKRGVKCNNKNLQKGEVRSEERRRTPPYYLLSVLFDVRWRIKLSPRAYTPPPSYTRVVQNELRGDGSPHPRHAGPGPELDQLH
jgi:hypothetical protein